MKLTVDAPVLFSGRPARSKSVRDIHLTWRKVFDIPEIAESEAEVAYGTSRNKSRHPAPDYGWMLRTLGYDRKLYRIVGPLTAQTRETCLEGLFGQSLDAGFATQGVNSLFENRLLMQQAFGQRSRKTWPPPTYDGLDSRNETRLDDVIGAFDSYDPDEYAECRDTVEAVGRSFLMIGGKLWCETAPPCTRVLLRENLPNDYRVFVGPEFASTYPQVLYQVTERRFAIGDGEAAEAYVEELKQVAGRKFERHDDVASVERMVAAPDLGGEYEAVRRIARQLALSAAMAVHARPKLAEALSSEQVALLAEGQAELVRENHILGRVFDMADEFPALLDIWRSVGRPHAGKLFDLPPKTLDRYLSKVLEGTPISVLETGPSIAGIQSPETGRGASLRP